MTIQALALLTLFLAGCQAAQTGASAKAVKEANVENLCNDPAVIPQPAFDTPALSVSQIEALIVEPTNVDQLLANIRRAADRDLLVQNAFFDDAVLRKFFGATLVYSEETFPRQVYPTSVSGPVREVFVSGSRGPLAGITVELRTFTNCKASFAGLVHPPPPAFQPPKIYVTSFALVRTAAAGDLNVGIVKRIFGSNPTESEGFCNIDEFATYCSADTLHYSDLDKIGQYPIPFSRHDVEFNPLQSPQSSSDRRSVHFDDDSRIALITIFQSE